MTGECTSINCHGPQGPGWEYIMGYSSSSKMISSFRRVYPAEETMVAKRQSESVRAKSQQRYRRKRSLFKKAKEFFLECESDVFVAVRIRKNGQIYIFDSSVQNQWLRDLSNLVHVVLVSNPGILTNY